MLLYQLNKYPSHFETFSSCSLNKKILTIRDKMSKMKGQEFKKISGYGFQELEKFLERFVIVLMMASMLEKSE